MRRYRFAICLALALAYVQGNCDLRSAGPPQNPVVLPPSFLKPHRAIYSTSEELWFQVRVVPHPTIHTLRVELWELAAVEPSRILHHLAPGDFPGDTMPDVIRYEPREVVRSSDEPLMDMTDPFVKPRTVYPIQWKPVQAGQYEIKASVLTTKRTKVYATRRIQVL